MEMGISALFQTALNKLILHKNKQEPEGSVYSSNEVQVLKSAKSQK